MKLQYDVTDVTNCDIITNCMVTEPSYFMYFGKQWNDTQKRMLYIYISGEDSCLISQGKQSICCRHALESHNWSASNEYPQYL